MSLSVPTSHPKISRVNEIDEKWKIMNFKLNVVYYFILLVNYPKISLF